MCCLWCVGPEHRLTVLYLSEYVGPSSFLCALCGSLCSTLGWAGLRKEQGFLKLFYRKPDAILGSPHPLTTP